MAANNIKVAIKVRPILKTERDCKLSSQWRISNNYIQSISTTTEPFKFDKEILTKVFSDHIFDKNASSYELFDAVTKPVVAAAVKGINGAVFTYGETCSGKTYTMLGDETNPGIIILTVREIFKEIESLVDREFLLRVSYIKLHNEQLYDLLHYQTKKREKGQQNPNKKYVNVKIHDIENGDVAINCIKSILKNENDLIKILQTGNENRSYVGINKSDSSSKSHTIFQIIIESRKVNKNPDEISVQISTLNLVDLASSAQAIQCDISQKKSKENSINNKSLHSLSQIIKDLSEGKELGNINYRNSKLTKILKAPLGNNGLAAFICNINPTTTAGTYATLNFAMCTKNIQNDPRVNEISVDNSMLGRLYKIISQLKKDLEVERCNKNKRRIAQLEKQINNEELKILHSQSKISKIIKSNKETTCLSSCVAEKDVECADDNITRSERSITEQVVHCDKNAESTLPVIDITDLETPKHLINNDISFSDSSALDTDQRHELMLPKKGEFEIFENLEEILKHNYDASDKLKKQVVELEAKIKEFESEKLVKEDLKNREPLDDKLKEYKKKEGRKLKRLEEKANEKETELRAIRERYHQLESENSSSQQTITALLREESENSINKDTTRLEFDIRDLIFLILRLSAFEYELEQQNSSIYQREKEYMATLNEKDVEMTHLMNEILSFKETNKLVLEGKELKMLLVAPSNQEMQSDDTLYYQSNNAICNVKDNKMVFKESDKLSIQLPQYIQESFKLEIQEETLSSKQLKDFNRLQKSKKMLQLMGGISECRLTNKPKNYLSLCHKENEILKYHSKFCNDNQIVRNFVSYLDSLEESYKQLDIDIKDKNNIIEDIVNQFMCSNKQQLNLVNDTVSIRQNKYQIKFFQHILKEFNSSIKDINLNPSILLYNDHKYYKQSFSKQINSLLHNSLIQLPKELLLLNNPILYRISEIDYTIQKLKAIIQYQETEKNNNKHEMERINVRLQHSCDESAEIKTNYASLISENNILKTFIEVFKNEFIECMSKVDNLTTTTAIIEIKNNILSAIRNILTVDMNVINIENLKNHFNNIKYQIKKKLSEKVENLNDGIDQDSLILQLAEMKNNNTKLLNEFCELNLEIFNLTNKLSRLENDKFVLEQKLLEQNKSCRECESSSSELKASLLQKLALENSIEIIKDSNIKLKNELLFKKHDCESLQNKYDSCKLKLSQCEKQNESLENRIQKNDILIRQAEEEYKSLRTAIDLVHSELLKERKSEALSQKNIALQDEINIWQQKHSDVLNMYNKENQQCLLYKTKITSLENAVKYQQDEVNAWQDKYADIFKKLNKKSEQYNQLNENSITLKAIIKELELKLEKNLNMNKSISQEKYDEILQQCNEYQDEINKLKKSRRKLNKNILEITEQKNQLQDTNIVLKNKMKIIKEKYDDTSKKLSEEAIKCLSHKNELLKYEKFYKFEMEHKDYSYKNLQINLEEDINAWEHKYNSLLNRYNRELDYNKTEINRLDNIIKKLNTTQLKITKKNENLTMILENIYDKLKQQLTIETLPKNFELDTNSNDIKLKKNIFDDDDNEIYAQRQELIDHLIEDHKNLKLKNEKLIAEIESTRQASQKERKVRRQTLHDEKRQSGAQ